MAFNATSARTSRIMAHLHICGFNQTQINSIVGQVVKWETANGPEWTVTRLKTLKEWLITLRGGNSYRIPPSQWIKSSTYKGQYQIPKGVFGFVFKLALGRNNFKLFIKAISAIMVYTDFKHVETSSQQSIKTLNAFKGKFIGDSDKLDQYIRYIDLILKRHSRFIPPKLEFNFSFSGLNTSKPVTGFGKGWLSSFLTSLAYRPVLRYLRNNFGFSPDIAIPVVAKSWTAFDMLPGTISVIQERGLKARVVAMPSSGIQVCLEPLHKALNKMLRMLPEDCTFNHEQGAIFAHESLQKGLKLYSIDLSSATDRFPRDYSLNLLRKVGLTQEADLINYICNDDWLLKDKQLIKDNGSDTIRYSVGQPQGMYASFPLFAWSHHMLLQSIIHQLKKDGEIEHQDDGYYRLLGDDIIINNHIVARAYKYVLTKVFGVEISESKSIISNDLAEFASYLVTTLGYNKPKKVPDTAFYNSYLNYVQVLGYSCINRMPKDLQDPIRLIAELPQNYGGLGLNPGGKPRYVREDIASYLYKRSRIPSGTSMASHILHMCMLHHGSRDALSWLFDQNNQIEDKIRLSLPGLAKSLVTNHKEELFQLRSDADMSKKEAVPLFHKFKDSVSYDPELINQYIESGDFMSGLENTIVDVDTYRDMLKTYLKDKKTLPGQLTEMRRAFNARNKGMFYTSNVTSESIPSINNGLDLKPRTLKSKTH